jgi:selenocysteine-specific elongation factor
MAHVIIGTAGHIDHGKTSLIRALTGIETDRFEEEKRRGITIDLGFAYFDLPSGRRAGIVDVPGHERFIRNMLAGASGVDLVLLVISAEEGVMPQTQEHLDILTLLNVKKGIVVLTKSDLVDEDWLGMIQEEIREKLQKSFLKDAPMICVSSVTRQGLQELVETMDIMLEQVEPKKIQESLRLPIDRVFTMTGFGTVVTGTLVEGILKEGDAVEIYPKTLMTRVRMIQVHGEVVKEAFAGQRVAVNLAGVNKSDLHRGDVLAKPESLRTTHIIDASIQMLESTERTIHHWMRVRLYQGTKEVLCRVVLLDREVLNPGESCFAQLHLEEEVAFKYGDHVVLRFYSPLETIGGGMILDPNAHRHKRFRDEVLDQLAMRSLGDSRQIISDLVFRESSQGQNVAGLEVASGLPPVEVASLVETLVQEGEIHWVGDGRLVHAAFIEERGDAAIRLLNDYHQKHPLKVGMPKEEIRNKLFPGFKGRLFDDVLNLFLQKDMMRLSGSTVSLSGFEVAMTHAQKEKAEALTRVYRESGFNVPNFTDALASCGLSNKDKALIDLIFDQGALVKINDSIVMDPAALEEAKRLLLNHFESNHTLNLGDFRDLLQTSRKVAVPLLEYFDSARITVREGDTRKLRKQT